MRTVATRIGRTVPAEFGGTVRAVWSRACAVAPDPAVPFEGEIALVTLVRGDVPMTAASIALDVGSTFDFAARGLCRGDRVGCDGAALVVSCARSSETMEADLRGAVLYDGFSPETRNPIDRALLKAVASAARRHWRAMCGRSLLGVASSDACDALLDGLSHGAHEDDVVVAERAAQSLVGLGPGLTPSGDDALCGFILGRTLSGAAGSADAAIKHVARGAAGLTSDVSAVQLELAARGRFGEALLGVAEALCTGDALLVSAASARCLAEGATSGADGLLGLVAGMRECNLLPVGVGVSI